MVVKKHVLSLITLSVVLALGGASAFAADSTTGTTTTTSTTTTSKPATKLVSTYSTFAGSDANATALVNGLRTGKSITLTSGSSTTGTTTGTTSTSTGTTTFTPATSKLGYGNVNIALALAQAEFTKLGITNPTPAQLQAALNGGTVTTSTGTTTLSGVLKLRSEGMGWGAIAKSLGFKLGAVVSASKTDKASTAREGKIERVGKAERLEKVERPERIERPEKVERPERVERPKQ